MAELTTGLVTYPDLGSLPANLRVTWIAWDSPFRATDLAIGDRIVGVNGTPVENPADLREMQQRLPKMVGQYAEAQAWEEAALRVGAPVELRARRRRQPRGWREIVVTAGLAEPQGYRNADNRIVLGPGGPDASAYDGFSPAWGFWYDEAMVKALSGALDIDFHTGTFVTRYEYQKLKEQEARIGYAKEHYPGPWADTLHQDFQAAATLCRGRLVELAPGALDFRRRGEQLAAEIRATAVAQWEAFQKEVAGETVAPFPALNPVRDDIGPVIGKHVVLPSLGNSDWISEAGHGWFAAGREADGWYFLDAESDAAQAMLVARLRFSRLVDPSIDGPFELVARILGQPRLVVVGERAHFGLVAEPVAALVGGDMFVNLTTRKGALVSFAGEDGLVDATPDLPPADAAPEVVLATLVQAVKEGDIALWRALHADWLIERREDATMIVHPHERPPSDDFFERSRRSMAERVLDARVAWVSDPVIVTDGSRFPGALAIEEVEVWLDHVGSFDGETRTFADVTVSRKWGLQRVDGGPWRVSTTQEI